MENEILISPPLGSSFEEVFWVNKQTLRNKPLTLKHVAPSFMILVFGVMISLITFCVECFLFMGKRKTSAESATDIPAAVADENIDNNIMEVEEIQEHHSMEG